MIESGDGGIKIALQFICLGGVLGRFCMRCRLILEV